jgi:hypothetical protein
VVLGLVCGAALNGAAASATSDTGKMLLPRGNWTTFRSISPALTSPLSEPPGDGSPCPKGTTYKGKHAPYSCMEIIPDNYGKGHSVWVRVGRAGSGAFGYSHAYIDHNLDLGPIEHVILSSSHGLKQGNGRYEYGAKFTNGKNTLQWVYIYEQRAEGKGSPDKHPLGMVTAFCKNASYKEENKCPDWVNETL